MIEKNLIETYNYDEFIPEKSSPWMRFDESPPLGQKINDFPLWNLEEQPTHLLKELNRRKLTFVEFGSFT